jgi:hypothetical protein
MAPLRRLATLDPHASVSHTQSVHASGGLNAGPNVWHQPRALVRRLHILVRQRYLSERTTTVYE